MTLILIASWSALLLYFLIHRSRQSKKLSSDPHQQFWTLS